LLLTLVMTSGASAAPVEGPAGEAFYTPPATLPEGGSGTLVWFRPATLNFGTEAPSVNAWDVLYKSSAQLGATNAVTGTVIVPTAAWTGSGSRPVVTLAEGTQGLAHQCAPSLQLAAGTEYDAGEIVAALKKGYAAVVTDYPGYTNGATPEYLAGKSEGHSVLDIVTAAQQIPGSGVSASAPVAIWGYSQGGQAAAWAAQLAATYASGLNVVGTAAGGTPADLAKLAEFGEGGVSNALGLDSFIGLLQAYSSIINPEAIMHELLNEKGLEVVAKLKTECALESLKEFHALSFQELTKEHKTAKELSSGLFGTGINEQKLGGTAPAAPVYHYHGLRDEFVPVTQDVELHQTWCSLGVKDDLQLYSGDHLLTNPAAISRVIAWIEERFAGKTAPSTCGLHEPGATLPPSARLTPEVGDLIIPIPEWEVTGKVTDKKLGIALKVPAGATFSSEADVTAGTLTASLFVPPIRETMNLFGLIPVTIEGSLTQAGPITGTFNLSNTGVLEISATGGSILATKAISVLGFRVPIECHTSKPVELPLSVKESANALAGGALTVNDTVTIPPFTGGVLCSLTSLLLSGPGNPVNLTVSPPPPIPW
jgi:pimeloyl-ACP methyl ester carboxylesterase